MAARRERYRGQQPAPAGQGADDEAQSAANAGAGGTVDPDPAGTAGTADPDEILTGEVEALTGELEALTGDFEALTGDFEALTGEVEALTDDESVALAAPADADFDETDAAEDFEEETEAEPDMYDAEIVDEQPETGTGAAVSAEGFGEEDDEIVGPLSLADELGVQELGDIVFVDQGRLFSAAGRTAPIVELTDDDDLLIRPPEKPLSDDLPLESIEIREDDRGILLNELGERRKILGVKFRGCALYYLGVKAPEGTQRHYVGFFNSDGNLCRLYLQGRGVTTDIVYKLRVRTHDGELGVFPELSDDPDHAAAVAAPDGQSGQ